MLSTDGRRLPGLSRDFPGLSRTPCLGRLLDSWSLPRLSRGLSGLAGLLSWFAELHSEIPSHPPFHCCCWLGLLLGAQEKAGFLEFQIIAMSGGRTTSIKGSYKSASQLASWVKMGKVQDTALVRIPMRRIHLGQEQTWGRLSLSSCLWRWRKVVLKPKRSWHAKSFSYLTYQVIWIGYEVRANLESLIRNKQGQIIKIGKLQKSRIKTKRWNLKHNYEIPKIQKCRLQKIQMYI